MTISLEGWCSNPTELKMHILYIYNKKSKIFYKPK